MAKSGRRKGNSFELATAKLFLKPVLKYGFTKKDCYRRPLSGGHPQAGKSDLKISKRLLKLLPFVVECKHTKQWQVRLMLLERGSELIKKWMVQAVANAEGSRHTPLLVMSGDRTGIFVAAPLDRFITFLRGPAIPSFTFGTSEDPWLMIPVEQFLKAYRRNVRRQLGSKK